MKPNYRFYESKDKVCILSSKITKGYADDFCTPFYCIGNNGIFERKEFFDDIR